MYKTNVDGMNFDELRSYVKKLANQVTELSDLYSKTTRKYEDLLCNLSRENLSIEFINEQEEYINSTIQREAKAFDVKLEKYSTIKQTEDEIKTSVGKMMDSVDETFKSYSTTQQTADSILSLVSSQREIKNAVEVTSVSKMTDESVTYKICTRNTDGIIISETYYYYSDIADDWIPFQAENLYTVFKQTSEGFEFKGNVIIDGDAVITKNLKAQKIVSQDGNEIALLTMVSNGETKFPDLTYYGKVNDEYQELFGIRYDGAGTSYIRLNGIYIGYVGVNKEKFYPLGTWCFSENNGTAVEGLGVVPVFGG